LQSIKNIPTFRLWKVLGPMLDTLEDLFQADDLGPGLNDLLELVAAFLHEQRDTVLVLFLSAPFFLCKSSLAARSRPAVPLSAFFRSWVRLPFAFDAEELGDTLG